METVYTVASSAGRPVIPVESIFTADDFPSNEHDTELTARDGSRLVVNFRKNGFPTDVVVWEFPVSAAPATGPLIATYAVSDAFPGTVYEHNTGRGTEFEPCDESTFMFTREGDLMVVEYIKEARLWFVWVVA